MCVCVYAGRKREKESYTRVARFILIESNNLLISLISSLDLDYLDLSAHCKN